MKIDGRKIAEKILEELKIKVKKLQKKNIVPNLAIILIGNDTASLAYVNQKKLKAKQIGVKTTIVNLESRIQNSELNEILKNLNNDNAVNGIIVQRPVPQAINTEKLDKIIDPKKDVDGFHPKSKFEPPIALAVLKILEKIYEGGFKKWLKNKKIAVIGKGETGGKPIINSFKKMGINPIVIDSKTENPQNLTKTADIIISAVGKPQVIKPEMIKKGATLISVGLHKGTDGKLHGDYDEEKIKNVASFYTPTPGGVGPINVAYLLKNVVTACENLSH
ncbi:MAG: bifunctional 5,10-methylenetetrahydrofolate dehydrogenase/5,10-methenyltetrahydrofolate cyclohydrolase [Candidatus Levybacteria bacterium]|nr:bifunctional 5,10-methylenetetrahydrofolate dehydrogenase/5,10-methenyltetrahydrofolate cyclohydrolase [Candidatus Levybacteria bacterium]